MLIKIFLFTILVATLHYQWNWSESFRFLDLSGQVEPKTVHTIFKNNFFRTTLKIIRCHFVTIHSEHSNITYDVFNFLQWPETVWSVRWWWEQTGAGVTEPEPPEGWQEDNTGHTNEWSPSTSYTSYTSFIPSMPTISSNPKSISFFSSKKALKKEHIGLALSHSSTEAEYSLSSHHWLAWQLIKYFLYFLISQWNR